MQFQAIKSIISCLGTSEFNRIKVGVGRPKDGRTVVGHVLNRFEKEEEEDIIFAVQKSVDAIRSWIETSDFGNENHVVESDRASVFDLIGVLV